MKNEEISVQASVMKKMMSEKINPNSESGTYSYEDIVRYEAEEVWKRTGLMHPMSDDYYFGFLAASKLESERRKNESN